MSIRRCNTLLNPSYVVGYPYPSPNRRRVVKSVIKRASHGSVVGRRDAVITAPTYRVRHETDGGVTVRNPGTQLTRADGVESAPSAAGRRRATRSGKTATDPRRRAGKTRAIVGLIALAAGFFRLLPTVHLFFGDRQSRQPRDHWLWRRAEGSGGGRGRPVGRFGLGVRWRCPRVGGRRRARGRNPTWTFGMRRTIHRSRAFRKLWI